MFFAKRFILSFICLLLVTVLFVPTIAAQSTPDNPVTIDIGHILSPESFQHQALLHFKELVEEKSNGEIKVEVFPAEQLGHAPDMVENVSIGAQDMMLGSQTWWEVYSDKIGVATIPFLFEDRDHFHRWIDKTFVDEIYSEVLESGNQRIINLEETWQRGPFRVIVSTEPIFTPDDLEGLSLRLWPARMIQRSWEGFGVDMEIIDFAETYLALQYGTVKAVTSPFDLVWPQGFTEVAKYVTELRQFPQLEIISINNDLWESLSSEHQDILLESVNEAGRWYNQQTFERFEELRDRMINEHDAVYIMVNREPFVNKMYNDILPKLIQDGLITEEWIEEVEELR